MKYIVALVIFFGVFFGTGARGQTAVTPTPPVPADTQPAVSEKDAQEFNQRRVILKADDIAPRLDLAMWCKDRGLYQPMAELAQEVLNRDPDNSTAYGILAEYHQKTDLPTDPELESALKTEFQDRFGRPFKIRPSAHFLIVYDTPDLFASRRAAYLERAYDSFYFFLNLQKLHPQFLTKRLVVVLFNQRADFLKYAHDMDGADMQWASGYYTQHTNRAAFYDDTSGPNVQKAEEQIADLKAQMEKLTDQVDEARARGNRQQVYSLGQAKLTLASQLQALSSQVRIFIEVNNAAKTTHEATHQLAFNTGIQTRFVDYPLWLSEGLATCFESTNMVSHTGPEMVNSMRLAGLKPALGQKAFIPLEQLLGMNNMAELSNDQRNLLYSESWGLFHFLYRTRRDQLEKLLLEYNHFPVAVAISANEQRKLFSEAFGDDLAGLEKEWVNYLKRK